MTQVRNTVGRWVQRFASKPRAEVRTQPAQRPQELDARVLTQVGGGTSTDLPNKNW